MDDSKLYRNITEVTGKDMVSGKETTKTKTIYFKQLTLKQSLNDGIKFRISKGLKSINEVKQEVLSGNKETKKLVE